MLSARTACRSRDGAIGQPCSSCADTVGGEVDSPLHGEGAVGKRIADVDLDLYGECWPVLGRGRDEHVARALAADRCEVALEARFRMGGNHEDCREGGRTQKGQKDRQWPGSQKSTHGLLLVGL